MADTKQHPSAIPVESDGVSYSGVLWFVIILTATTLFCQAVVWGMFEIMERRASASDAPRSPLAVQTGTPPPGPNLLTDEPANLQKFQQSERDRLSTYGLDKNTGAVRIPIDRAKELVLERGLPARVK